MSRIPMDSVLDSVITGLRKAQKQYDYVAGEWLSWAPEYLATVSIWQAMRKNFSRDGNESWAVTLEGMYRKVAKQSNSHGKGRYHDVLPPKSRSDIVLWWGKDRPRAIIEVKCPVYRFQGVTKDVAKVCGLLKRKGLTSTLQFGAIAYYSDAEDSKKRKIQARDTLDGRWDKILKLAEEHADKLGCKVVRKGKQIHGSKDDAPWKWMVACIVFQRTKIEKP